MNAALPLGALLRREVVAQLRRVRSFVLVVIVLLILVWVVAAAWPSGSSLVWARMPMLSTQLLTGIVYYLLIGAGLFVPGIAATTIVVEREQQSWDLLRLTQLRPSSIVAGKALGAVCIYLLIIVALFPVVGALYFLVGIDWAQSVVSLGLVLLTAVTCSFAGVASSAWTRRSGPAVAWSYMMMLFVMGLPAAILLAVASVVVNMVFDATLPYVEAILSIVSPFPVLMASSFGTWASFTGVWLMFAGNIIYQVLLIAVLFFIALAGVRRRKVHAEAGGSTLAPPRLPRERVSLRRRLRERRIRRRKRRPPIPDGRNPIAVREIWWGTVGSSRSLRGVALLLVSISGVIALLASLDQWREIEAFLTIAVVVHGIIVIVLSAGLGAGIFTKEDELRGIDMLRITLMTPRDIVRGKFIAGLRMASYFSLFSVLSNGALYAAAWGEQRVVLVTLAAQGTILVCALIAVSAAMAVSVYARRTSVAVVGAFVACGAFFFGLPLLLGITDAIDTTNSTAQILYAFSSPIIGFFYAADQYDPSPYGGPAGAADFLTLWAVNCLEFLVVTCLIYLFASASYARYHARGK